jgi:hypothetical protein
MIGILSYQLYIKYCMYVSTSRLCEGLRDGSNSSVIRTQCGYFLAYMIEQPHDSWSSLTEPPNGIGGQKGPDAKHPSIPNGRLMTQVPLVA